MSDAQLEQPDIGDISMLAVLHALADPARLQLVQLLAERGPTACSAAQSQIELHKSTVSHHWKVLREAGVTSTIVVGRERVVSLRRQDLDTRFPGLLDAVLDGAATADG